jgi:predicted MPP superfamily phosphohydrolase
MRFRGRLVLKALAVLGGGLLVYGVFVEPNRPVLRRVSIPCPGLAAPIKILLFSDVDFPRAAAGRALVRETAGRQHPDLIFVAGDFLDRPSSLRDVATVAAAGEELGSLPAAGRFVALGEAESGWEDALRRAWAPRSVTVGANDAHLVQTPGGPIDLFVADVRTDPAPWGLDIASKRPTLVCRGRHVTSSLTYTDPGSAEWRDVEITLAFFIDDEDSYFDIRFGWVMGVTPEAGSGWRLLRHADDPAFRLLARFDGDHRVEGRARSGYVPEPGCWHRARIVLEDDGAATRVRARFWQEREAEPDVWAVDVLDRGPARRHHGTIGFAARAGERRIAELRVSDPGGSVRLDEPFDDRSRFEASWSQASRLAAWAKAAAACPRIVLAHHPDVVRDLALIGAPPPALVVAGHTHGGQVALPGFGPLFTSTKLPRRLAVGLGSWRGIPLFVTPGIGTSVVPVRIFVPPEVDLLTLVPVPPAAGTMPGAGEPR